MAQAILLSIAFLMIFGNAYAVYWLFWRVRLQNHRLNVQDARLTQLEKPVVVEPKKATATEEKKPIRVRAGSQFQAIKARLEAGEDTK